MTMRVLKDVSAVAGDAARIWADVVRFRLQKETQSLKQAVLRFVIQILAIVAAFLIAIAGIIFILVGCYWLLASTTLGRGGGALLLGAIVILFALVVGLGVAMYARKA
jgi:hypothetical protein